jgi:hypothetical protein
MKPSKLNVFRWILLFLTPVLLMLVGYFIDKEEPSGIENSDSFFYYMASIILWMTCTVAILVLFIYHRNTISRNIKIFLLAFMGLALVIYLIFRIFDLSLNTGASILIGFVFSFILSIILSFISYLEKIEIILLGLLPVIIIGFVINRFGISEGGFIIPFAFCLSSVGFILLVFKNIPLLKTDKIKGLIFVLLFIVIAILNALFLIKFLGSRPALNNMYDTIGVVVFLMACLALFISLPFSNFTEWPKFQKLSFKRLIITPLILFLIIFSLKFLLPDKTYRSIFFKEYSNKEIIHFNMEDYKIDFSE